MIEHVSRARIERFSVSALPEAELNEIVRHLAVCSPCHKDYAAALQQQRGRAPVQITLAPEFWLRHEHLDYEQLARIADFELDPDEREMIDTHLRVCPSCAEDVRSFLAFRRSGAIESPTANEPIKEESRERFTWRGLWPRLAWKPAYAVGLVLLLGIALAVGVMLVKRRSANLQAQGNSPAQIDGTSPTPMPTTMLVQGPSPSASEIVKEASQPTPSPATVGNASESDVIVFHDAQGEVSVDKNGRVKGIENAPAEAQQEIAEALLVNRIESSKVLEDLTGPDSTLRGSSKGPSFKLLSPARTVIVQDRPTFKWDSLSGASSYRVYITDKNGREVERSPDLPESGKGWTSTAPLKRGEIYSWAVIAVVDGKEIVSPGPSQPEVKFQVLSSNRLRELSQLKRTRSHLALGVFYAKVGMISDAEREFQQLVRLNPDSKVAANLLRSMRAMRHQRLTTSP